MAKAPGAKTSLTDRLMAAGKIPGSAMMDQSEFFKGGLTFTVPIPMMNVALCGSFQGGAPAGITTWAGPSKHFKTLFGLIQCAAFLDADPENRMVLYDSEFGAPLSYFTSVGIDPERVLHVPITSIEQLRTEMSLHLAEIKRGDKIIMMIDSIGNLASTKEIEDALSGSDKADMTRAKVLKSLFRIITPHFKSKNINLVVINHTYQTMEMYSKTIMGGGTGNVYAADNIFFLGKQQEQGGSGANKEFLGFNFIITVNKSRFIKERSKIPITVLMEGGIQYYSGLFDVALEAQFIEQAAKGSYRKVDMDTGIVDEESKPLSEKKIVADVDFWENLLENKKFNDYVENKYQLGKSPILGIRGGRGPIIEDTLEEEKQ